MKDTRERLPGNGPRGGGGTGLIRKWKPRVEEQMRFLGGFLRGPAKVGAIGPSSRSLAEAMIHGFVLESSDTVVELGPGTGAFTGPILRGIGKKTTFFAVEIDPIFTRGLKRRFPGVVVYNDSAENVTQYLARHGKEQADYIISGLPWASLPIDVQDRIFHAILRSLAPGGLFTTFGYVHARWFPNALRFRSRLERHFSGVETSKVVWGNFPPAFIYRCRK